MSASIEKQFANRVRQFLRASGISQRQLSRMLGIDPGNFNAFLSGVKTLSQVKTSKLLQILNLNRLQLEAKFRPTAVRIEHFQENGQVMRMDNSGGWVSGQSGVDPNDSTDITGTNANPARTAPNDKELEFLAGLAGLHKEIIDRINGWQAANITPRPNPNGVTEAPRKINSNSKSSSPGIRGDMLSITPRQHLEYLQRDREAAEQELVIQKQILAERRKAMNARIQLSELQKQTIFSTN